MIEPIPNILISFVPGTGKNIKMNPIIAITMNEEKAEINAHVHEQKQSFMLQQQLIIIR